ncbi:MAG TPA: hypothetical protein DCP73_06465 [Chloroflexi bacterium]|nr:hypothetical protein [Chloroflexota bacterium]
MTNTALGLIARPAASRFDLGVVPFRTAHAVPRHATDTAPSMREAAATPPWDASLKRQKYVPKQTAAMTAYARDVRSAPLAETGDPLGV